MPDKPLETTWAGTTLAPALRRGRRFSRRVLRQARSRVRPRAGLLGDPGFTLPSSVQIKATATAAEIRRLDALVIAVPTGSAEIPDEYVEPLILAEQHSVPTVLTVTRSADLKHPLAAVVTHAVTTAPQLVQPLQRFAGAERTALLDADGSAGSRAAALRRLTRVHTPVARR